MKIGFDENYHKITVWDHVVWQNFGVHYICGQIPKAYNRCYTFYLVIFLTIFSKFILLSKIEWKISNSAKVNIEVSFKKRNPHQKPRNIFQKYTVWREKAFLVTFNILIHPEKLPSKSLTLGP